MSSLDELVASAVALRSSVTEVRPVLLGIAGPPGSGKSTLTTALHSVLTDWSVIEMDGFHLSNELLVSLGRRDRKGAPDTFDVDGFVALLQRVTSNASGVIYGPRFVRETEQPIAGSLSIRADSPGILVEGNYLLLDSDGWERVGPMLDATWYVDTSAEECHARLVARATLTYGPIEGLRWVDKVDEPNATIVRASALRASRRVVLDRAAT